MKTLTKAIAAASLATVSVAAFAETSITIGAVSDYYFRGVALGNAGAYASVDYENSGFYAGTWIIDDGGQAGAPNGLETDFYLGYGGEADGFSYNIGYNRYEYTYTSDFEHEIVLSGGIAGFGLDIVLGVDDDSDTAAAEDEADYTVIQLSYGSGPWGVTLGSADTDEGDDGVIAESEYKWFEVSYSADFGGVDATATIGQTFDAESGGTDETSYSNNYLILDVSKSFDL